MKNGNFIKKFSYFLHGRLFRIFYWLGQLICCAHFYSRKNILVLECRLKILGNLLTNKNADDRNWIKRYYYFENSKKRWDRKIAKQSFIGADCCYFKRCESIKFNGGRGKIPMEFLYCPKKVSCICFKKINRVYFLCCYFFSMQSRFNRACTRTWKVRSTGPGIIKFGPQFKWQCLLLRA